MDGAIDIHKTQKEMYYFISITLVLTIFCVVLSFSPLVADSSKVSSFSIPITLSFDQPTFSQIKQNNTIYTVINLSNTSSINDIGSPQLPSKTIHVLLPYQTRLHKITIESKETQDVSMELKNTIIYPVQRDFALSITPSQNHFDKQQRLYESNKVYPETSFSVGSVNYLSGFPIVPVIIHPFEYYPSDQKLFFSNEIQLRIVFEDSFSSPLHTLYRGIDVDTKRVSRIVLNPEALDTYPLDDGPLDYTHENSRGEESNGGFPLDNTYPGGLCDPLNTYEYVIVTSERLVNTTGYDYSWIDLIDHRQQRDGLSGTIVTVEDIYACEAYWNTTERFNDSAAQVREFIKDAYLHWATEYVLLGGSWQADNETRQIVPCRVMTNVGQPLDHTVTSMASDLYFSNLDGDWCYNGDMWGGGHYGNNDKYSELAVGRIPLWTIAHVSNTVEKILWYDAVDDIDWLRSAAFAGPRYLGWNVEAKEYMEELRLGTGSYSSYTGFEEWNTENPEYALNTSHRYYREDYDSDTQSLAAWKDAVNSNSFSMISHLDHGAKTNTYSLFTGSGMENDKFFLGTSQACFSGRYHVDHPSGAFLFLAYNTDFGVFAQVLNTGYGYGSNSTTAGASQYQHTIFWDYFFSEATSTFEDWRLGNAMRYTKDTFADLISSCYARAHVWYGWNLFGDPAQQLRIHAEGNQAPRILNPDPDVNSTDVSVNYYELSVLVTDTDNDLLNWTIETSPDIGSNNGTHEPGGIKTCMISKLTFDTMYTWFVNVSDGTIWTNERFVFTTRSAYIPQVPTNFQAISLNRTSISMQWSFPDFSDVVLIERNTIPSWERGNGIDVFNDSKEMLIDMNLSPDTQYFYQAWGWNTTDQLYSIGFASLHQTTLPNHPPEIQVYPENNSMNHSCSLSYTITIHDKDSDELTWTIVSSTGIENSSTTQNTTETLLLKDLVFNTTYTIWVNVSDTFTQVHQWFQFTTHFEYRPPLVHGFSSETINRTKTRLSWENPRGNHVLLEYQAIPNWDVGEGTCLYNGSASTFIFHDGLEKNTTYHYRIWQYNTTYQSYSKPVHKTHTTPYNMKPVVSNETPMDQSTITGVSISWSVDVLDADNDLINWSIESSCGRNNNGTNEHTGRKTLELTDLPYETMISLWVNVSDGFDMVQERFSFFTPQKPNKQSSSSSNTRAPGLVPVNTAPVADIGGPLTGFVGEIISFSASNSSDADGDALQFRWDFTNNGHWDTDWSSSPFANTSYDTVGVYTVIVEVSDGKEHSIDQVSVQIFPGNHPPEPMFLESDIRINLSDRFEYWLGIVDKDQDMVRYRVDYGDGFITNWSRYQKANTSIHLSHEYTSIGLFLIHVLLEDIHQAQSGWVNIGRVEVVSQNNEQLGVDREDQFVIPRRMIQLDETISFQAFTDGFIPEDERIDQINWYVNDVLMGHGEVFTFTFTDEGLAVLTCEYYTSDGIMFHSRQTIDVQQSNPTLFLTNMIFFFVVGILCFGVIGFVYYQQNKNRIGFKK